MSIPVIELTFHYAVSEAHPAFWFLTAWNPCGGKSSLDQNRAADRELEEALTGRLAFRMLAIRSTGDDEKGEPGWGFTGDSEVVASLAKRFGQAHAFHFVDGIISRLNFNTLEWSSLGSVGELTRDPSTIRHFTLFVGSSREDHRLTDNDITEITTLVGECFQGFSYRRSMGCFENETEDTLEIGIGTHEYSKVLKLAHTIRKKTDQTGVGILCNAVYQRVREWTDDGLILKSFDLS